MIAVSGVEVADAIREIAEGHVTRAPAEIRHLTRAVAEKLDLRGTEKRHGESACQIDALRVEANADGESLDQVFAIVAVKECARAEKESQRRVDGRLGFLIPGH